MSNVGSSRQVSYLVSRPSCVHIATHFSQTHPSLNSCERLYREALFRLLGLKVDDSTLALHLPPP